MCLFVFGLFATILFATSLGVWYGLKGENDFDPVKPPKSKKYFSLLRTTIVCLLAKSTNLKSLKRYSQELWNNGRYQEATWLKEEIERIKFLMLKK
jgi:hypothetical protein